MKDEMLTVAEVAPLVRMNADGLYRACRENQFPHIRIGRQIRIPRDILDSWKKAQARKIRKTGNGRKAA
jgi:excisionase family DNA binding protein